MSEEKKVIGTIKVTAPSWVTILSFFKKGLIKPTPENFELLDTAVQNADFIKDATDNGEKFVIFHFNNDGTMTIITASELADPEEVSDQIKEATTFSLGDPVIVNDPDYDHEFSAIYRGWHGAFVVVEDAEGNVFDTSLEHLTKER